MSNVRTNEAVLGRTDYYRVDPTQIIIQNNWNPRVSFDAIKLEELKESIKENGVLVPIRVKINNSGEMILIDGERRLRATLLAIKEGAEIVSIPAIVERKTMNEIDQLILALTANTGEPLSMIEEANAIKKLQNYGLKVADIAKKLGKSIPTINNRLSLLDASPELIDEMQNGEISFGELKKIVNESDGIEDQKEKVKEVKEKKAKKKSEGKKSVSTKDLKDMLKQAVEWLNELNKEEEIGDVIDLVEKINNALDE